MLGVLNSWRGAQGVAHVDVAVADGEDLALAVDVGDLVHKAVVLGLRKIRNLVVGHVVAAVGLDHIVGHIAHGDAPVLRVVAAALAQLARLARQEQVLAAYLPSYLSSQWEMCCPMAPRCSVSMAFSTGMTCMPIPAPPGAPSA